MYVGCKIKLMHEEIFTLVFVIALVPMIHGVLVNSSGGKVENVMNSSSRFNMVTLEPFDSGIAKKAPN